MNCLILAGCGQPITKQRENGMELELLIAEADRELCDLYQRFFTHLGYRVQVAHDGVECLDKLRSCRPKALILELELPWGSGEGVLERMAEDEKLCRIPVILVSDRLVPTRLSENAVALIAHSLTKPCRLKDLLDKVALCTEGKSIVDEPYTVDACP